MYIQNIQNIYYHYIYHCLCGTAIAQSCTANFWRNCKLWDHALFHLRVCGGHMFTRSTLFDVKHEESKTSENALDSSFSLTHLLPVHPFSTN